MSELYRDFIEDQFDRVVNAINNELPTPTASDIGKVVQVVSDGGAGAEYALDAVPNELPTPTTSDIDKVVKVISDGSGGAEYALDAIPNELPTPTSDNNGSLVTIKPNGSGGYEYQVITPTDVNNSKLIYSGATLGWRFTTSDRTLVATINRSAGTVSVSSYSSSIANNVTALSASLSLTHSDNMGQDNYQLYFNYVSMVNVLRYSPFSQTIYRLYESTFTTYEGNTYKAVIKLDTTTGTGTYTEFPVGGTSTPSEITLDFSPWKYGGVQEAEVASKLGDGQNTNKETIATITAVGDTTVHFSGIRISTNTGSNEGYFNIEVNGTNVHKQSLNSDTWQQFTNIPDVQLTNGDVLTVNVGFDGTHTGCYFRVTALQP